MSSFSVGDRVQDTWWQEKTGRVVEVLKTRVKIEMNGDVVTYDRDHYKFLRKLKRDENG